MIPRIAVVRTLTASVALLAAGWLVCCHGPDDLDDNASGGLRTPEGMGGGIIVMDPPGYKPTGWSPLYPNGTLKLNPGIVQAKEGSVTAGISFAHNADGVQVDIPCAPADIYGGGLANGAFRLNGHSVILRNFANDGLHDNKSGASQSHPWVLGLHQDGTAFGVLVDCTYPGRLDVTVQGHIVFTFRGAPVPRIIIIEKEHPADVVKALSEVIGKIELPPLWALGYHHSHAGNTQAYAITIADQFRDNQIPADALWFGTDAIEVGRPFTFNRRTFPSPRRLATQLHDRHFHTVWTLTPGIRKSSGDAFFTQGSNADIWVKNRPGGKGADTDLVTPVRNVPCVFPDFLRPETRDWWSTLIPKNLPPGVDGFYNEWNEPSTQNNAAWEYAWHRGGGTIQAGSHDRYRNVYGLWMAHATRQGMLKANPNERPFILSRANFIGGQREATAVIGGSLSTTTHMKLSVPMTLSLGLSGQPLAGTDMPANISGRLPPELAMQWMALMPFYPVAHGHSRGNLLKEVPYPGDVEASVKLSLERRYRLLPYLYTIVEESTRTGLPMMRPMFFLQPSKRAYRTEQEAFMLGNDLVVIPTWSKKQKILAGLASGFHRRG